MNAVSLVEKIMKMLINRTVTIYKGALLTETEITKFTFEYSYKI